MLRKTLCRILCCIAILCLTATSVFAVGYFNGSEEPGSIRFDFSEAEPPVTGGSLELRQVAYWDDDAKALRWCSGWEEAGLSLDQLFGEKAAASLFVWASSQKLPAQTLSLDAKGSAKAEGLALGVYLVSQTTPFEGYICMLPALISVPMEIEGAWILDVEATPKLEPLVPETTTPTTEPTPPPELPPTGQVNWPVPLLLVVGAFLIVLGVCLRKLEKHETEA